MKRRRQHALLLALALTTCSCDRSGDSRSPTSPSGFPAPTRGSGTIVREIRSLASFRSVALTTAGTVNLTQGTPQFVRVSADDNVLPLIVTTATNGVLSIARPSNVTLSNYTLTVDITMGDVERLTASSAGSFQGQNQLRADSLTLVLSSAGSMTLDLLVDALDSTLSSVGSLTATGSATTHRTSVTSVGSLHAFGLTTDTTRAAISSLGNAEVFASSRLDVTIGGSGSLFYRGRPMLNQVVTGTGRVIDAN